MYFCVLKEGKVPLFCCLMIDKSYILEKLEEILESQYFVVDLKVSSNNKIQVFLDGDQGLPIDVCAKVSRALEAELDREEQDFEMSVSSAGADAPLSMPRQYTKHIGRRLDVYDQEGHSWEGELKNVDETKFKIFYSKKIKNPETKKKKLQEFEKEFLFSEVQKVKVKVLI